MLKRHANGELRDIPKQDEQMHIIEAYITLLGMQMKRGQQDTKRK